MHFNKYLMEMLALGVIFIYRIRDGISEDWRWEGEVFTNTHSVPPAFQNTVAVHEPILRSSDWIAECCWVMPIKTTIV